MTHAPASTASEGHRVGLVRRAAGRSEAALEELYRDLEASVHGLVLRIVRDEKAAEEATVEVFERLWARAASYDPARGRVLAWVLAIARSVALETLRTRRREAGRALDLEEALDVPAPTPGPAALSTRGETAVRVDEALRALPREQERVLRAAFFGGLSYREVAETLGQPVGTVKTRIRSGLAALRAALAPEGGLA
jgi:RNA polymerase sigma-70 factor (ECF subfamily)